MKVLLSKWVLVVRRGATQIDAELAFILAQFVVQGCCRGQRPFGLVTRVSALVALLRTLLFGLKTYCHHADEIYCPLLVFTAS